MNILKKLKLALLATSVMLFPKAGHTIKPEDGEAKAGVSRQLRAGESDLLDLMSMEQSSMPGSSLDQVSPTAVGSSFQDPFSNFNDVDQMKNMQSRFGRAFAPNQNIIEQLSKLHRELKNDQSRVDEVLRNIRENVFNKFVFSYTLPTDSSKPIEKSIMEAIEVNTPALQNLALTALDIEIDEISQSLPKGQLQKRLEKLEKLIVDFLVPTTLRSMFHEGQRGVDIKLNKIRSHKNPNYISLVSDLLKLQPSQIESFYSLLTENMSLLFISKELGNRDLASEITDEEENITVIKFLTNKSREKRNAIIALLKKITPEELRYFSQQALNNTLKALTSLDIDTFTARTQRLINHKFSIFNDENIELGFLSLSLMVEDKDFKDFLRFAASNWNLFAVTTEWSKAHKLEINPALWDLSFKEIKERVSEINAYRSLLAEAAQGDTQSNIKGEARFMALTPAEIYETARSQYAKNYFFKSFLPKVADRLQTPFPLPATEELLKRMFPFMTSPLKDFSPELLQEKLGDFHDLFQLPSFPEFQPSGSIESGPSSSSSSSSSSGLELEETVPSPSSSSSIHSAPTTFRTAGANETAEIKHSAIYASFSYQNKPGAAYSLIINHRTKDKGSEVRVFNPNTKTYIDLGRLSPSMGFSDQVFNLSSLFASAPSSSSGASSMKTELNFIDGISDIHSFTIKSGEERLMEVILGDEGSEKQTGVYVYAPEVSQKRQEWSEVKSEDVEE
jgi:hypothetical protein